MTETRSAQHSATDASSSSARVPTLAPFATRALALGCVLFGVVHCKPRTDDKTSGFPRAETFYLGGRQWGEPSTFNPLGTPGWPISTMNLLYETLLMYDSISGQMQPLLAESYAVHDDSVEVTLNPRARWNDGQPVSAWDVSFTFELGKKYKSLNIAPIWQYLVAVRPYGADGAEAKPEANAGEYPRRVVF
ncbi:MAG TPA: hypothetical protein VGJ91_07200, partial [Polyangiaceae bacterium]